MVTRRPESLRVSIRAMSLVPGENAGAPISATYVLPPVPGAMGKQVRAYRGDVWAELPDYKLASSMPGFATDGQQYPLVVDTFEYGPESTSAVTEVGSAADVGTVQFSPGGNAAITNMLAAFKGLGDGTKWAIYPTGLGAVAYCPSYPTADFMNTLRQVCAATGYPIREINGYYVLFPGMDKLPNIAVGGFRVTATAPEPLTTVQIQWYATTALDPAQWSVFYTAQDVITVGAGERQEISVQADGVPALMDGTLNPVGAIPTIPYDGAAASIYCVTGSDGYAVSPARWQAGGGGITVRRGPGAKELIITVVGADDEALAPYTITEGADRPALYVTTKGGVLSDPRTVSVSTGQLPPPANVIPVEPPLIDCPYIDTEDRAYAAAYRLARRSADMQLSCSGVLSVDRGGTTVAGQPIPELTYSRFYQDNHYWLITEVDWEQQSGAVAVRGEAYTTLDDFNNVYAGKTCGDFNTAFLAFSGRTAADVTCSDFNMTPLVNGAS